MNTRKCSLIVGLLLCLVTALASPQGAMALGTPACTSIGNFATVNFQVGGTAQTAVTSATNTIQVGNRVDVIVTTTDVAPGPSVVENQSNALLNFTITNNGNANQTYRLSAIDLATGSTSSVFAGNVTVTDVVLVSAGTATTADAGGTPLITTSTVAPDGTLNVTIRATMTSPLSNDTYDAFALRAVTLKVDGLTTEATATVGTINSPAGTCSAAIVLGDGAGTNDISGAYDGSHSARSAYHSVLTTLSVNKTSIVVSDPINGVTNPKAIPGAVMEYTVSVVNSGGTNTATNVAITDTLPTTLVPVNPFTNAGCTACAGACIEHPAATFTCNGSWSGGPLPAPFTLNSTDGTGLSSGATTTFKYRATIQ